MLVFNQGRLTQKGKELLAEVQGGQEKITFTKFAFGSGAYTSADILADRTSLKEQKQEFVISSRTVDNRTTVTLHCVLTNKLSDTDVLTEGYDIREVGVFARNAAGEEILYSIATAQTSDRMPAYDGHSVSVANVSYTLEVGDAESVEIVSTGALASAADLNALTVKVEAHLDAKVASEEGAHGLRYWDGRFQIKNSDGIYVDTEFYNQVNQIITKGTITAPLVTENGDNLVTENGDIIMATKRIGGIK